MLKTTLSITLLVIILTTNLYSQSSETLPQPGNSGANAFEFIKFAEDAAVNPKIEIELELAGAKDNLGKSETMIMRFQVPFKKWISFGGDYRIEKFQNTSKSIETYNIEESGIVSGDLNLFSKIMLFEEKLKMPHLSLKVTLKTAAGASKETRRYTDSAGYEFSVLASKDLFKSNTSILKKIRVFLEAGFTVWDTGLNKQNDAYKISGVVNFNLNRNRLSLGSLYYKGWIDSNLDEVLSTNIKYTQRISDKLDLTTEHRAGLTNASVKNYIGIGARFSFDRKYRR